MSIRVVIADDAPFIREVVRNALMGSEIEIIGEASDGREAIAKVRELQPDVVLMDIVMPHKSGIEATQEIAEEFPKIKIVAFSTLDQETMVMKALEVGCVNYIAKPFTKEDLIKAIKQAVS